MSNTTGFIFVVNLILITSNLYLLQQHQQRGRDREFDPEEPAPLRSAVPPTPSLPPRNVTLLSPLACQQLGEHERVLWLVIKSMFLEGLVPRGDVLDVGANLGDMSCFIACLNPARTVHAMDPNSVLMRGLRCPHPNLRTHVSAIAAKEGRILWSATHADRYVGGLEDKLSEAGNIPVTTLDVFFRGVNSTPGLLHLDVEGYELEVLVGGEGVIMAHRPLVIFEVHLDGARRTILKMEELGYVVFMVNEVCGTKSTCRNLIGVPKEAVHLYLFSNFLRLGMQARFIFRVDSARYAAVLNAQAGRAVPWRG